jgi:hypothetical protein
MPMAWEPCPGKRNATVTCGLASFYVKSLSPMAPPVAPVKAERAKARQLRDFRLILGKFPL